MAVSRMTCIAALALAASVLAGGCSVRPSGDATARVGLPLAEGQNRPLLSDESPATPYTGETAVEVGAAGAPGLRRGEMTSASTQTEAESAPVVTASAETEPPKLPQALMTQAETGGSRTGQPLTAHQAGEQLKIINAVVAEINGEVVTREDLLRDIRPRLAQWSERYGADEFSAKVRIELRERLRAEISRRLLLQEARKAMRDEQTQQIEAEIEKERQRQIAAAGGRAKWEEALDQVGLTPESWHKLQMEGAIIASYVRAQFEPKISVTRQELIHYYDAVRAERYEMPTRAHLQMIRLRRQDYPDTDTLMVLARGLVNRARGGEDFATLAEKFSTDAMAKKGGDWGTLQKGSLREEEVDAALFTLPVGSVSDPIVATRYVYIVKVVDRAEARTAPFTEVQDEVMREVRAEKRTQMLNDYIANLYRKAYIKVHDENL